MKTPHMPNMRNPISVQGGVLTTPWAKFLGEILIHVNAEMATGRVVGFELVASDLIDSTKFVTSGSTTGLGVGDYLGWAYCNGNNGTTDRVAEFAAFTTLVPLMRI
ncbi:MAG: hypothetical protein A2Y75_01675 [Candidatus Solincola sediminis]|uniref:Uncharacterized protein n=1 Tax=Candidatus Solincola sediminis TaxID=1797199 RepID=A0A1F2WNL9_9ACTN|nr:MAG: hypothetical protein A2Y75_01675 [Candidatus Solincola sediminis]